MQWRWWIEATVSILCGATDCFRTEKGVHRAICCYRVYLTYMRSTLWEIPGWMNYKLESRSVQFSSVQFSHSVVSDSLRLHGLQHARLPCPSPTPRVKVGKRNISNLRYADDTTLVAESKEELKIRLMRVKEERLKLNIKKTKNMASSPIR